MSDHPDILAAVLNILRADTDIDTITGGQISGDRIPQGDAGRILVAWVVSEVAINHLGGSLGMDQARIQIDSYGQNRADAGELAWYAWKALDAKRGIFSDVEIKGAERLTGVRQETDPVEIGTDQYRFLATQDFRFTYCSFAKVFVP